MRVSASRQRTLRLKRLYGLTDQEYDMFISTCSLCGHSRKVGLVRLRRKPVGGACWGCRKLLTLLRQFPTQRSLYSSTVQDRVTALIGACGGSEHAPLSPLRRDVKGTPFSKAQVTQSPERLEQIRVSLANHERELAEREAWEREKAQEK